MRFERLPDYCRPGLPECRRLTKVVAAVDPKLVACWNGHTQRYELWGPSRAEGWAMISVVEGPDGASVHPDLYPLFMLAELRRRDQPLNVRKLAEQNAQLAERIWHAEMDEAGEGLKYAAKAVAQELAGTLRHGAADVRLGLQLAMEGGSRAPRRQQIYLPGGASR